MYRLTRDGASIDTLVRKAKAKDTEVSLLIIQDTNRVVFGALVTDKIKFDQQDNYYGNGMMCVFTFVTGVFSLYPATNKNSYYLLCGDPFGIAIGGGGNFAVFLDADLNKGSSGFCDTFNSPRLSSDSPFTCADCELYKLQSPFT